MAPRTPDLLADPDVPPFLTASNPKRFPHYGDRYWGITASGGPGPCRKTVNGVRRQFFGYVARGVPEGPDDGTTSPWAVAASLPFAPEIVAPTITHLANLPLATAHPYGFKASFNWAFDDARRTVEPDGFLRTISVSTSDRPC